MSQLHSDALSKSPTSEFSVRIVVCDNYLSKPSPGLDLIYSEFRGTEIKQVPILRIFGTCPDGRKACLHVHGVFPYFYIPCPTSNPEPQFLYQIAASLDKALNIALKQATSSNQHVYKISLVKGLPFYGFHDKDHLYLKVFLYNPGLIKQAVELCSNGAILGQTFQPHESHLNFTLQFFIDFNLFGMSNIELQSVKFRKCGISQSSSEIIESPNNLSLKPESVCYYEADCLASHIINRQKIGRGDGIENPGLEEVWQQEKERRKQLNISMSKTLSQGQSSEEQTDTHKKYEQMFMNKISNLLDKPLELNVEMNDTEVVHYPAESLEGSQLFNAIDVSMHLPESSISTSFNETAKNFMDSTLVDADDTLVDENVALNSSLSLHYSQILLNSEDLDLVDMLQDMEESAVEEDAIINTPAKIEKEEEGDSDDAEYSQAYNDDTILLDQNEEHEQLQNSLSWNDSFWDSANIPQLDGTCDDDHVKKVRKRKMRSFKLGLSKPKTKKDASIIVKKEPESKLDISQIEEINVSRETVDDISDLHIKRFIKHEVESLPGLSENIDENMTENVSEDLTVTNIVNKWEVSAAHKYDKLQKYEPHAGPSNQTNGTVTIKHNESNFKNASSESSPEDLGIVSFYNSSKLFDISVVNQINNEDHFSQQSDGSNVNANTTKTHKLNLTSHENASLDVLNVEKNIILTPKIKPPTKSDVVTSLKKYNIPKIRNPEPYFSNPKDVGDKVEIGQMLLKLHSKSAQDQKPYQKVTGITSIEEWRQLLFLESNATSENMSKPDSLKLLLAGNKQCILQPVKRPPTKREVTRWLEHKNTTINDCKQKSEISKNIDDDLENSQAIGLNDDEINNSLSFESSGNEIKESSLQITMQGDGSYLCFGNNKPTLDKAATPVLEVDFLTVMVIEVLTAVRGDLHPDPNFDPIQAVFITITNDCPENHYLQKSTTQIIVADPNDPPKHLDRCLLTEKVLYVNNENEIIDKVIDLVKTHDPDIMCGYEIEMNSWGYLLERAQIHGIEIIKELSRITEKNRQKRWRTDDGDFEGKIIGRITFNVWRLLRHELALSSYSFENCMYVILKERVPKFSYEDLSKWWQDPSKIMRWIPVEYYLTRLSGTVRMLEKLDIINRTSELARLFGLQWWEVLSRGSQFRVESLMLRAARPLNLVALSPTVRQRAAMKAPECLPLIFEPESRFYTDPVIVLDFQSLYPSMMIAYNYCFSTCIGRVQNVNGDTAYEFGAWRLRIPKSKLETLAKNGLINWSPVGVGFVKPSVRRGVLPALLRRILAARLAVKKGMKLQSDEAVKKAMHSRQLGLKLIANVTYGYTAANFSGRMPCVEVGDSVVAKGRETLERAIKMVRDNKDWNVRVIYGDTDSMFVLCPGMSRTEAFEIGKQIADAVTADNPAPVALKLEKVYQPCILQTKKRYVGFMYESADQEQPVYEAKGIETVRRDGIPAGVKLLQQSLCELFTSGDMSRVKTLVTSCLQKVMAGSLPVHELFFTREYRGPGGYRPGAAAPPKEIANRLSAHDRRSTPRTGERVSWLVAAGPPAAPLVTLARTPLQLLKNARPPLVGYYVTRVLLPPLQRCLSLLGADVFKWWTELGYSRESHQRLVQGGIARYMWRDRCLVCGARGARALCVACARTHRSLALLAMRLNQAQTDLKYCDMLCGSCCCHTLFRSCENTECPIIWRRQTAKQKLSQLNDVIANLPPQVTQETLDF